MHKSLCLSQSGFLHYFPIYCIITTLLHLSVKVTKILIKKGWAQGFTIWISLRKRSFVKLTGRFPPSADQCVH